MQKTLGISQLHKEDHSFKGNPIDFVCNNCAETFHKPIFATVSSSGQVQTYYACPRCMARIKNELKEITVSNKVVKKTSVKLGNNVKCKHSFGYLKKRAKNTPIPDECLTCNKMIECMIS